MNTRVASDVYGILIDRQGVVLSPRKMMGGKVEVFSNAIEASADELLVNAEI